MYNQSIRWSYVVEASNDTTRYPEQKVEYLGVLADASPIYPYGFHANATPDSLALLFSAQGLSDNKAFIPTSNRSRPELKAGEVAFYQPETGAYAIFREAGDIEIITGDEGSQPINLTCTQVNVTATESVTVDSPESTFNGNVTINGNYTSTGTMKNNGLEVGSVHKHDQDPDSSGNTQVQIEGVV